MSTTYPGETTRSVNTGTSRPASSAFDDAVHRAAAAGERARRAEQALDAQHERHGRLERKPLAQQLRRTVSCCAATVAPLFVIGRRSPRRRR